VRIALTDITGTDSLPRTRRRLRGSRRRRAWLFPSRFLLDVEDLLHALSEVYDVILDEASLRLPHMRGEDRHEREVRRDGVVRERVERREGRAAGRKKCRLGALRGLLLFLLLLLLFWAWSLNGSGVVRVCAGAGGDVRKCGCGGGTGRE